MDGWIGVKQVEISGEKEKEEEEEEEEEKEEEEEDGDDFWWLQSWQTRFKKTVPGKGAVEVYTEVLEECLSHPNEEIQFIAARALASFVASQYSTTQQVWPIYLLR